MRIALFGGHGKVALLLSPMLVERGDTVSAVFRNPDHFGDVRETGAEPVLVDIENLDVAALASVVTGHDAVVWSAGAGGGSPERTRAVDRDAAIRSMQAAERAGIRRYVMVSYLGARPDHGVPHDNPFFAYAEAKAAADAYLKESDLDWTILGPSTLTLDPPTGRIEVGDDLPARQMPRADVAAVIAETLRRDDTIGRFIGFNTGEQPIAEALG